MIQASKAKELVNEFKKREVESAMTLLELEIRSAASSGKSEIFLSNNEEFLNIGIGALIFDSLRNYGYKIEAIDDTNKIRISW